MKSFQHDLNRYLTMISSGHLPEKLPEDLLCREQLLSLVDRMSFLSGETQRLEALVEGGREESQTIAKQERLYRSVFENAVVGIMIVAGDGRVINANQAIEYMLGYQAEDLKALNLSDITLPDDQEIDAEMHQDVIDGKRIYYQVEKRYVRNDGILFWGMVTVSVVWDETGTPSLIYMVEDISARKSAEMQMQKASTHDAMTGLYNRAHFDREFNSLQFSMRMPVSIIVIDVDGLKQLNDTKGHEAGDRLIVSVAAILRESFRGDDIAARVGGDEFSVLLPETNEEGLHIVMERLLKYKSRFNEAAGTGGQVEFSVGAATAFKGEDIPKALKLADERMYADKVMRKGERAAQAGQ